MGQESGQAAWRQDWKHQAAGAQGEGASCEPLREEGTSSVCSEVQPQDPCPRAVRAELPTRFLLLKPVTLHHILHSNDFSVLTDQETSPEGPDFCLPSQRQKP